MGAPSCPLCNCAHTACGCMDKEPEEYWRARAQVAELERDDLENEVFRLNEKLREIASKVTQLRLERAKAVAETTRLEERKE